MAASDAPPAPASPAPRGHESRRAMRTPVAAAIAVAATLAGLIVLAWTILFVTRGRFLKHPFERFASAQAKRPVRVAGDFQLYFAPFDLRFVAEGLTIANPDWAGPRPFLAARRIDSRIASWSLLFGRRRINWLALDGAAVDLRWDAAGRRNSWTFGDGGGEPLELPLIHRALVAGTMLQYRDPRARIDAQIGLHKIEARDTRFASAVGFDGRGTLRGAPFRLTGALRSPDATLRGGRNALTLHVEAVGSTADIAGTLPGATEIDGATLRIDLRGRNLAEVFALAGIAVPDTRRYRLQSAVEHRAEQWHFRDLRGRFGDSDLAGTLDIAATRPRLKLTADLSTRRLDILDAGPFIGYDPQRLDAEGAKGAVRREGGTPRVLPDARLRIDALDNFDADVRWKVATVRAEALPIANVTLGLTLDHRLLRLDPLDLTVARGAIRSRIEIDARQRPVRTRYDIRLSPTPMGVLLAGLGVAESGTTGTLKARAVLTGRGDSVHESLAHADGRIAVILPKGSFWTRNVQLSELDLGVFAQKMFEKKLAEPVQINCGLVAFSVRDGIAAADPILIDTEKNVMLGRGGFSFRNESLDLAFRADGKTFSLFSAQSPVGIGGAFAAPRLNVLSPELVARAGAGLGLGLAASPLAGVLAFVDFGDAKAADCGPVLAGATARGQRDTKGRPRDDVGRGTPAKSESGQDGAEARRAQRHRFLGLF